MIGAAALPAAGVQAGRLPAAPTWLDGHGFRVHVCKPEALAALLER
jgi:hypothetical protein